MTLAEAWCASVLSVETLGRLIRKGRLPNAGRKFAPRIHRGDLPLRRQNSDAAAPDAAAYDPVADARSFLERGLHRRWRARQAERPVRSQREVDAHARERGCRVRLFSKGEGRHVLQGPLDPRVALLTCYRQPTNDALLAVMSEERKVRDAAAVDRA